MDEKFLKPYNPQETEDTIYRRWEENGFFNPDTCLEAGVCSSEAESFSIVLPPPNVTGTLHMGHAAMLAIEDILVRFHRMRGKKTLWLPGTDHAAIATQSKVESILLKKDGKNRHDLGREAFLEEVKRFAQDSHDTIVNQVKKMGSSVDWSREAYTLDEKRNVAVRTAFKSMFDMGLIHRGARIVNWDPKMQTTVSDDEIVWEEEKTDFYYLRYGPFIIATARPETKFGDKYVVMHPDDSRYAQYAHGQQLELEWINGPVTATIIKDTAIDMAFGTGVMTITPWHDLTDFEIAKRHNLDKEQIIDFYGKLLPIAGEFAGTSITKARPLIVEKLQQKGLVEKVEHDYVHRIAKNDRGGGRIEPQIKEQWFIDVDKEFPLAAPLSTQLGVTTITLKQLLHDVVEKKLIRITPDRFEKTYFHWIDNLRPWCISRQIWFGHRIPVWYRDGELYCGIEPPSPEWESQGWTQDTDTLDTWFSSGLWTFSTMGWPEETSDLKTFHPTSVLETGYDILFFWVARMILMTGCLVGDVPFTQVYLHGLVRDEKGRKMSKSIGNIIDPVDMIDKYGADAARLSLIIGAAPGNDIKLSEERIRGYKHFTNKLWNIARFVLSTTQDLDPTIVPHLTLEDEQRLEEVNALVTEVTDDIENFRLYLAGEKLYHYVWDVFAATILEERKAVLFDTASEKRASAQWTLMTILATVLKLLHPFIPFVTEEIWAHLPGRNDRMLIVTPWPEKISIPTHV
jgi:valyl-tRNA synthetase